MARRSEAWCSPLLASHRRTVKRSFTSRLSNEETLPDGTTRSCSPVRNAQVGRGVQVEFLTQNLRELKDCLN